MSRLLLKLSDMNLMFDFRMNFSLATKMALLVDDFVKRPNQQAHPLDSMCHDSIEACSKMEQD